jgi:hypothetical protein
MGDVPPSLIIRYSSEFSLSIQLSSVQVNEVVSPDYRFDFACRIHHPTGEFTYTATDIYFAPEMFRDFAEQLEAIRRGKAEHAQFHDYGQMIEFSLSVRERRIRASLKIREYQAGAEQTLLSAGFPVDYDLFVNALYDRTMQFLTELETAGGQS